MVVHNAKELRCGEVLEKLPVLLDRMRGMLVRFLNTVQAAHVSFLDEGAFERWSEPIARGQRRLAGIDLNKARNRHVLNAVVSLSTKPDGFTTAEVDARVRARTGWSERQYATRHAAYDLAKLRGRYEASHPREGWQRDGKGPFLVRLQTLGRIPVHALALALVLEDESNRQQEDLIELTAS